MLVRIVRLPMHACHSYLGHVSASHGILLVTSLFMLLLCCLLTLQSYPLMLTYDAEMTAAHMQMLQTLVARSSVWADWGTSHSTTSHGPRLRTPQLSAADMGDYTYALDRPGWQAFYWEAKAALQEEHADLSGPELRVLLESHWNGYKAGYLRLARFGRCEQQPQEHLQQQQQQQQAKLATDEGVDAGEHVGYSQFMPAALARFKADHPSSTHEQAMEAVQQQYRQQQRQRLQRRQWQQQQLQQGQQGQQATTLQPSGQANPWPLQYSRGVSGRLLLRLEYLLAAGLQEQVRQGWGGAAG
jgi:hypothetical protein